MFNSEFKEKLSAFVRERREQLGTPGVALAVVSDDRIVYAEGFGVTSADPEQAVKVTPRTLFRIGSTTKPMTGTLLLRLVEEGKLSLDEPIVTYLPWFRLSDPNATTRLTLRHLMSHQSGLPWGSQFFGSRDSGALEAFVREQVPRMPLLAPPGLLFSYSNVGTNVAGYVAEPVGGASFAELMQTRVFEPLGMERTTLDPLRALSFPLAQAHEKTETGIQVRRGEPWAEHVAYHPSAMVYSTVLDVANFARLHLNQGEWEGQQILSRASVAEMQRTQADEYQADGRTVGLNFALSYYRGHRRVGHGGGIASFGSIFSMLPESGVAVIVQFNESAFWQATEAIVSQVFDAALERLPRSHATPVTPEATPREPDRNDWHHYTGTFLGPRSGAVDITVAPDGNGLRRSRRGKPGEAALTLLRPDLYTGRNDHTGEEEVIGFIALKEGPDAGTIGYVMLNGAPCARVHPNPAFRPDPNAWQVYTGTYEGPDETSSSGRDVLILRCENSTLKVYSRNRAREEAAIPWEEGCFLYRERLLRFPKNASATPATSFSLGDPANLYQRLPSYS